MIELHQEHLLALREVPKRLPPRANGKRLHISAVYRWILRGIRGVILESVQVGGTTYTSEEALQRFAERLGRGAPVALVKRESRARARECERARDAVWEELRLPRRPAQPSVEADENAVPDRTSKSPSASGELLSQFSNRKRRTDSSSSP